MKKVLDGCVARIDLCSDRRDFGCELLCGQWSDPMQAMPMEFEDWRVDCEQDRLL